MFYILLYLYLKTILYKKVKRRYLILTVILFIIPMSIVNNNSERVWEKQGESVVPYLKIEHINYNIDKYDDVDKDDLDNTYILFENKEGKIEKKFLNKNVEIVKGYSQEIITDTYTNSKINQILFLQGNKTTTKLIVPLEKEVQDN